MIKKKMSKEQICVLILLSLLLFFVTGCSVAKTQTKQDLPAMAVFATLILISMFITLLGSKFKRK